MLNKEETKRTCFKFICQYVPDSSFDDETPAHKVEVAIDGETTLPQIVEQFERFLLAASFVKPQNHHLDWIENETNTLSDD